jgi:hypothetical protein
LFEQIQFLRAEDGSYWTGWQFANAKHFPHEQSTWTAAAVVLAADVLAADVAAAARPVNDGAVDGTGASRTSTSTGAAGIFMDAAAGPGVWEPSDPAACGCPPAS